MTKITRFKTTKVIVISILMVAAVRTVFAACNAEKPDYTTATKQCWDCKTAKAINNSSSCNYQRETNLQTVFCNCSGVISEHCSENAPGAGTVNVNIESKSGTCDNGLCSNPSVTGTTSGTKKLAGLVSCPP